MSLADDETPMTPIEEIQSFAIDLQPGDVTEADLRLVLVAIREAWSPDRLPGDSADHWGIVVDALRGMTDADVERLARVAMAMATEVRS